MKQVLLSFIIIILSNAALNAQLPANPTYELVQNGYTGVDSTLAGAITSSKLS